MNVKELAELDWEFLTESERKEVLEYVASTAAGGVYVAPKFQNESKKLAKKKKKPYNNNSKRNPKKHKGK